MPRLTPARCSVQIGQTGCAVGKFVTRCPRATWPRVQRKDESARARHPPGRGLSKRLDAAPVADEYGSTGGHTRRQQRINACLNLGQGPNLSGIKSPGPSCESLRRATPYGLPKGPLRNHLGLNMRRLTQSIARPMALDPSG
jgi:hypothetical protein